MYVKILGGERDGERYRRVDAIIFIYVWKAIDQVARDEISARVTKKVFFFSHLKICE